MKLHLLTLVILSDDRKIDEAVLVPLDAKQLLEFRFSSVGST